jgi:hypothetical protein
LKRPRVNNESSVNWMICSIRVLHALHILLIIFSLHGLHFFPKDGGSGYLQNFSKYLSDYTMSHSIGWNFKSQFSQLFCLPKFKNISQSIITIPAILVFLIIWNNEDYFYYLASLITVWEVITQ